MTSMTTEHTLRMLGDNVTLTTAAWLELLDELRPDSVLAGRIRRMLAVDGKLPVCPPREPRAIPADMTAVLVAPGIYELTDPHRVYAIPSASTDRIHQIVVNTRTGAMRCDGPHCDGRTCSHQKRVRAARAGF